MFFTWLCSFHMKPEIINYPTFIQLMKWNNHEVQIHRDGLEDYTISMTWRDQNGNSYSQSVIRWDGNKLYNPCRTMTEEQTIEYVISLFPYSDFPGDKLRSILLNLSSYVDVNHIMTE